MTEWVRLGVDVRCGKCGVTVPAQKPVKVIAVATVRRRMYRGECCEGPAPLELTQPVERTPKPPLPFARLGEIRVPGALAQKGD